MCVRTSTEKGSLNFPKVMLRTTLWGWTAPKELELGARGPEMTKGRWSSFSQDALILSRGLDFASHGASREGFIAIWLSKMER